MVLVASGYEIDNDGNQVLASAELYDAALRTLIRTGSMGQARFWHRTTLLPDGRVLIAGGSDGGAIKGVRRFGSAELYDPATGLFYPMGDMTTARRHHEATLLPNGKILSSPLVTGVLASSLVRER